MDHRRLRAWRRFQDFCSGPAGRLWVFVVVAPLTAVLSIIDLVEGDHRGAALTGGICGVALLGLVWLRAEWRSMRADDRAEALRELKRQRRA